jgi:hypothetical protein
VPACTEAPVELVAVAGAGHTRCLRASAGADAPARGPVLVSGPEAAHGPNGPERASR